jgi:hypothetical protein
MKKYIMLLILFTQISFAQHLPQEQYKMTYLDIVDSDISDRIEKLQAKFSTFEAEAETEPPVTIKISIKAAKDGVEINTVTLEKFKELMQEELADSQKDNKVKGVLLNFVIQR